VRSSSPRNLRQLASRGRVVTFFALLPSVAAIATVAIGLAALGLWRSGLVTTSVVSGSMVMRPWSGALFVLSGLSLLLIATPVRASSRALRVTSGLLATSVLAGALWHAFAWALGRDLGADFLFFGELLHAQPPYVGNLPGRLAITTIVAFLCSSAALLAIQIDDRDQRASAQWFALVSLSAAFLNLVAFAFGLARVSALNASHGMAVLAAVAMFVLSIGILFARPQRGFPSLVVDLGPAGTVMRRLVPAAMLVPFALGLGLVYGIRVDVVAAPIGVFVYVIGNAIVFLGLVRWAARIARDDDRARQDLFAREQAAREAAEAANLAKSNFLAVMSHELRTPLSAVIGYQELLADGIAGPVNESQKHQLGRIKASAQHLLGLIDQILSYARIEAGREQVQIEPATANTLADDATTLVEPLARANGLRLVVTTLPTDVALATDPGKVRQILVNLLSNAVKFTPEGEVSLNVTRNGTAVHYQVRDTGIGIAPEHLDSIFNPFWQVENPSTRRIGGTGLGLSVTRRLARLLGGDVAVESALGKGSTFTVTLPMQSAPVKTG
jgi:signal transduction histidine kinase